MNGRPSGVTSRPHVWPCRHCDMVTDYHLTREGQRELAEGRLWQDEDYRAITFKDWLRSFEWETAPDPTHPDTARHVLPYLDDDDPGTARAGARFVPAQHGPESSTGSGLGRNDGWAEHGGAAQRREQLIRWHADDFSDGSGDGSGDQLADEYFGSIDHDEEMAS